MYHLQLEATLIPRIAFWCRLHDLGFNKSQHRNNCRKKKLLCFPLDQPQSGLSTLSPTVEHMQDDRGGRGRFQPSSNTRAHHVCGSIARCSSHFGYPSRLGSAVWAKISFSESYEVKRCDHLVWPNATGFETLLEAFSEAFIEAISYYYNPHTARLIH